VVMFRWMAVGGRHARPQLRVVNRSSGLHLSSYVKQLFGCDFK
jgi:hypothetical protein